MASSLDRAEVGVDIKNISPWYYEIVKFKFSLLQSLRKFSKKIDEMDYYVNTDPLTGLMNRRGMEFEIDKIISMKNNFSILLIDIDYFKKINDTYGHAQGDLVLKFLAEIMQKNFRTNDICCRYGGEEFIVIMPHSNKQEAYESAERFRKIVQETYIENIYSITISIGIASWTGNSNDISEIFKQADINLYQAKNNGRNRVIPTI